MSVRDRIYLTWLYGKAQFLVGGVYNLLCAVLLATGASYALFVDAFIIKVAVYAVTLYLAVQLRGRDACFFYINLGLSRRKLLISVVLADFLVLAVLLTIVLLIYG